MAPSSRLPNATHVPVSTGRPSHRSPPRSAATRTIRWPRPAATRGQKHAAPASQRLVPAPKRKAPRLPAVLPRTANIARTTAVPAPQPLATPKPADLDRQSKRASAAGTVAASGPALPVTGAAPNPNSNFTDDALPSLARQKQVAVGTSPDSRNTHAPDKYISQSIRTYCENNIPNSDEGRRAWQFQQLKELEARIDDKATKLDILRRTVEEMIMSQKKAETRANDVLVALYARMRPDAAAAQMSSMDAGVAGVILSALDPNIASKIVNEMESDVAARITQTILRPVGEQRSAK